jgi:hypothetical protein
MIGESTAKYADNSASADAWYTWYRPFFNLIMDRPEIKAFCYINWDWSQYPQWIGWGDARVEVNPTLLNLYDHELDSVEYQHAVTEKEFRQLLGYNDTIAPLTPSVMLLDSVFPVSFSWLAVHDNQALAHYTVYRNDVQITTLDTLYADTDVKAGDTLFYRFSALDRAGNESGLSDTITVIVPDTINKAINGTMDELAYWVMGTSNGAEAILQKDTTGMISGTNAAHVSVVNSTGTNWHMQFRQTVDMYKDAYYNVSFRVRADTVCNISFALQQNHSPWQSKIWRSLDLDTTAQPFFYDSITTDFDDEVNLSFFLGNSTGNHFWIDSVVFTEIFRPLPDTGAAGSRQFGLLYFKEPFHVALFPNPADEKITFSIENDAGDFYRISIYNGFSVNQVIIFRGFVSGKKQIEYDCSGLTPGIYLVMIENQKAERITRKLIIF